MLKKKRTTKKESTNKKQTKSKEVEIEENTIELQQDTQLDNEDRFYCTNSNLLKEMFKWKNSTHYGIPVLKKVKGKYIPTERWKIITTHEKGIDENGKPTVIPVQKILDEDGKLRDIEQPEDLACHEKYQEGIKYIIKYPVGHEREEMISDKKLKIKIIKKQNKMYIEDVTERVKRSGYAFDIDDNEQHRNMSNEFGVMLIKMGQKVSNHSYFRNYTKELKEDMQAYSYEKVIRGLPNYNFKFSNAFAYLTQAFFNSFKSILSKHYKQINIKRARTKMAMVQLQSNLPNSSLERCLGNQFRGNDYDSFEEF